MRFAYIDSNGNEVPIPSVDALALRVELGAITESTQLYDAQADQWGPASTHEIFHTLSRASQESDGFVAPPPVAPPPGLSVQDPVVPESSAPPVPDALEPSTELADLAPDPPSAPAGDGGSDLGLGGLDLAPAVTPLPEPELPAVDLGVSEEDDSAGGVFDFGAMDGGLELEASFDPPVDEVAAPMDFSPGADLGGGDLGAPDLEDQPVPDFSGGMDLESPMEFSAAGFDQAGSGSMDLEEPMSSFQPDDPPAWMEDEPKSASGEPVMDFSSVGPDVAESSLKDRRAEKKKPPKPKRRRRKPTAGLIAAVVITGAAVVGGVAAWPLIRQQLEERSQVAEVGVVMPDLPPELMPEMREASEAAIAASFSRATNAVPLTVQRPPSEWLSGAYLAGASTFPSVETFWIEMSDVLGELRGMNVRDFDSDMASALVSRGLSQEDADAVRERADSGFVAAAADRGATLDEAAALVDAALQLHDFLVANEDRIEHAPAGVVTTDPVLEVNPATPEIRQEMESRIGAVIEALGRLEYREQVTAARLWDVILARVQETGVR